MITVISLSVILVGLATAAPDATTRTWDDVVNPDEKIRLEAAGSLDGRIRVYRAVSERFFRELQQTVGSEEFEAVPDLLERWTIVLETSRKDIETNAAGGRNRSIIQYEIDLRKAIRAADELKILSTVELQDEFDRWTARAEAIRTKIIDVLFAH
ncbi:MAG TPA: hypothetical protein VLL97_12920 [Acidobacteriota bacterium]|nr:hypothetical protein [Acidobacteriota bacterium]